MSDLISFEVNRSDWRQSRLVSTPVPGLQDGQVLFRIDRFALTANNITYALTGEMLGYWRFFPTDDPWGRLPVMGFAEVTASAHPEVREGERVFGFFPMATHLRIEAGAVTEGSFFDTAEHRRGTAQVYRQYLRCADDGLYEPAREDSLMLLRGLFFTSFLVDDFLADNADFAADTWVISSASSKTAIALAHRLSLRRAGRVVGLTSARNRSFVERIGVFDQVLTYDQVADLDGSAPTVFVDHAGDAQVTSAVHHHLADHLHHSAVVGATHWQEGRPPEPLPGPTPVFFFAPSQFEKRQREWGPSVFQQRLADAWHDFVQFSDGWLEIVRHHGASEVGEAYRRVLEGDTQPWQGQILSLWEAA